MFECKLTLNATEIYNMGTNLNSSSTGNTFYQTVSQSTLPNRFVYLNQNLQTEPDQSSHVLINPHFKPKVYLNPNFSSTSSVPRPTIHVNPSVSNHMLVKNLNVNEVSNSDSGKKVGNNIHINPKFPKIFVNPKVKNVINPNSSSQSIPPAWNTSTNDTNTSLKNLLPLNAKCISTNNSKPVVLTRTKLIREPLQTEKIQSKKRRRSVRSKYKIVTSGNHKTTSSESPKLNRFKVDNRKCVDKGFSSKKKYVFVNRFLSIKDLARNMLLKKNNEIKHSSILNISGVLFRKTPNKLRRASISLITSKILNNTVNSKYKLVKKSCKPVAEKKSIKKKESRRNSTVKRFKIIRSDKSSRSIKARLMKKCNIPCPYYRKFGKCKGKDNSKCSRKHDPDQISLCTKFLQGACVDENCSLSHKVSPEKMPTCKYYLDGSCSREKCPYVHVKLSSKAEICRDFIEGFCKAGTECDKKHQYLCPDYEKYGKCGKQRCPYPHGKMVRKYLVNKQKFTKKCSDIKLSTAVKIKKREKIAKVQEQTERARYYIDRPVEDICINSKRDQNNGCETEELQQTCDKNLEFRSRPKLGSLPSFIGFDET